MNLRDCAIGNIEDTLFKFAELKLTRKERERLASYMAVAASNAYRIGYYAASKKYTDTETTAETFDACEKGSDIMADMLWRFTEAGK